MSGSWPRPGICATRPHLGHATPASGSLLLSLKLFSLICPPVPGFSLVNFLVHASNSPLARTCRSLFDCNCWLFSSLVSCKVITFFLSSFFATPIARIACNYASCRLKWCSLRLHRVIGHVASRSGGKPSGGSCYYYCQFEVPGWMSVSLPSVGPRPARTPS
jgi:hypothetical protein